MGADMPHVKVGGEPGEVDSPLSFHSVGLRIQSGWQDSEASDYSH